MQFTPSDYENMQILKEKLGTWKEVDNLLGLPHRSSTRIRSKLSEGENYNYTSDKAEQVLGRIDQMVDLDKSQLEYEEPIKREYSKAVEKYNIDKGLLSLNYNDFSYYDEKSETWRAGVYSNLETNKKISRAKARQIRGASLQQIRKINKAKQFLNQKTDDPLKAYELANDWQKNYIKNKMRVKNIAYQDKNGRWHWGKNGSGKKGAFAKESEVKKRLNALGIATDKDLQEEIARFTDQIFLLRDSP